ncbi:membrane protein insertase YidC [Porphyromonas levii]|uniref:membrane protein insertase YidC n=1 Tax=Porphyromonas levii TaxID=28114 RepID=UPI001B8B6C11|nr:membrane protein insertase YidC [Porphyromonas levii]MBR8713249.1 Membrane protein insertase YidC [Porphyromonas levii]MBR8715254.1 Membrane protein insertase YidC [Porphyromonas levii]MBR8727796.1 Membrane protein insertase YidC [Porphyromonas levii]MBR8735897.1 Membrane protein insertase YidC [Porphyromonas levii]MBR8759197.1 Membrane protein insertase YidC [Porphyromonas levii]
MDKNTITGFVLMGLVLVVFTLLGRPSKEELEAQQRYNDSIAQIHQQEIAEAEALAAKPATDDAGLANLTPAERDSVLQLRSLQSFGELASASNGVEQTYVLENDSVAYTFSTKGGFLVASELKQYKDYLGEPIRLVRPEDANLGFSFVTRSNRVVSTRELYFVPEQVSPTQLRMTLTVESGQKLSFLYTLEHKYLLDVQIESEGFEQVMAQNAPYLDAHMSLPIYQNEKAAKTVQRYSGIAYEAASGDIEKLSVSKSVDESVSGTAKWFAFRDMFFSSIFYSANGLESVQLISDVLEGADGKLKQMEAKCVLPIGAEGISLKIYTGPNDYKLLKDIDAHLKDETHLAKVVEMGGWFRFINIWLVQPVFNFLEKFISNYGLIILLLTIFIKLLLMPLTYKSFQSQAKMRVLKPQVDAITEKYPGEENMMKRQQETMALYRKAGVNQMGGCLPMLLQMPILMAMYQYFPTSINLRGESFLWALDLSTYDDVINWGFNIPLIGDHISLFCLLMTVTQVAYMKITQASSGQAQMPGMKLMPWIMAIMLFFFLNENAAALSYYYLLSMLISIFQTQAFKWGTNEEKLLAQLEANKKKPKKQSKWMARIEQMQKEQEKMLREQKKGK